MNEIKISKTNPNSIIVKFVEEAIANSNNKNKDENKKNPWLNFGDIPQNAIDYVKKNFNINLTGYKYVLEASSILHALSRHGEESHDFYPINVADFCFIPLIISDFDDIKLGSVKNNNLKSLLFKKRIGGQLFYTTVTEVRTGKKSLAFNTLYKRKTRKR